MSNNSIINDSWNVGLAPYSFDFVIAIVSETPFLCIGLFFVILFELSSAHRRAASLFVLLQCSSPDGRVICFSLSMIDCFRIFVFMPILMQRFLIVSLDRLFSLSIIRRLFPCLK